MRKKFGSRKDEPWIGTVALHLIYASVGFLTVQYPQPLARSLGSLKGSEVIVVWLEKPLDLIESWFDAGVTSVPASCLYSMV